MATYVDESELSTEFVDESEVVGIDPPPKKKPAGPKPGGNLLSYLGAAFATGPSKIGGSLIDLMSAADIGYKRKMGLPTFGVSPTNLSGKVDTLQDVIGQGTAFPVSRDRTFPERAVQTATGSLMFPGGVVSNVGASVTSETVQEIMKNAGASRPSQVVAGVVSALPWALKSPSHLMRTPQQQADKALRGYTRDQLDDAARLQHEAALYKPGNRISAAQALNDRGRILDLENFTVDSPFAPKSMLEDVIGQPKRAEKFAESISNIVGRPDTSLVRANAVESIIESALEFPKTAAGRAAAQYYKMLEKAQPTLSVTDRFKLAAKLAGIPDDVGLLTGSGAGNAAVDVAGTVVQPSAILNPATKKPFMLADPSVRKIDNYLKEVNQKVQSTYGFNATSADKVQRAGLRPGADAISETLTDSYWPLRRGKEVYSQTVDRLEPAVRATGLREAVARPAAEATIAKPAASWEKMEAVLKRGNERDVVRAFNIMGTETGGKAAFGDITKNMLGRIFEKHFAAESRKPSSAMSFAEELKKYPNIRKVVELSASQNGAKDPNAVATGFMRMLDIEQAAGRPRGMPGGATISEIERYAAGKTGASLLLGHGLAKASAVVRNAQYAINKAEMERLFAALDSPYSIELLELLAKESGPTKASMALYKALIGASQAEEPVDQTLTNR